MATISVTVDHVGEVIFEEEDYGPLETPFFTLSTTAFDEDAGEWTAIIETMPMFEEMFGVDDRITFCQAIEEMLSRMTHIPSEHITAVWEVDIGEE